MRRRVGVGRAARRRVKAGGVLAKGRQASTRAEWLATKVALALRSGGRCEVVLKGLRCVRRACDACHVVKRSAGGSDELDNLYHGCRFHHEQEDAPYAKGRLIVSTIKVWEQPAIFYFEVVTAESKFSLR